MKQLVTLRRIAAWCAVVGGVSLLVACGTDSNDSTATPEPTNPIPTSNESSCIDNPLGETAIYLRGGMNSWSASEDDAFVYMCNRFELVTEVSGSYEFKIGDADWSESADWGAANNDNELATTDTATLALQGTNLSYEFSGTHKLVFEPSGLTSPSLSIESCPDAPFSEQLYLRGDFNSWSSSSDYAMTYYCDGYYANVDLNGTYSFKIADENWSTATSFGVMADSESALSYLTENVLSSDTNADGGTSNVSFDFNGRYTIKLSFDENGDHPVLVIGPQTFVNKSIAEVTNVIALSAHYNSRDLSDKSPFGAVEAGQSVDFSFSALSGIESAALVIERRELEGNQDSIDYTELTRVAMSATNEGDMQRWQASYTFEDVQVYGYYFEFVVDGETYLLENNKLEVFETSERGAGGEGVVEFKPENTNSIRRYRHSSYKPGFTIPDWAKDAVYYYIFPDRFRNGDVSNDPNPSVDTYHGDAVEFHTQWMDIPWVPGDGSDEIYSNDFFGGDLAGIIEKLDYIQSLGVNTLYINPIFEAPSNHKYDTSDYKHIDDNFGDNALFATLTSQAKQRDIRVILDTSLNHTGDDSVYFDREGRFDGIGAFENGEIRPDSPYYDWYEFFPEEVDPEDQYAGWVGYTTLPELSESDSWKAYAYGDEDSVMNMWLDLGSDGWRMDVAPWVSNEFWRDWRTHVKAHDPDALTISETWFDASKHLLGDMFDSTMNYIFRDALLSYASGNRATDVYYNFELMRENYPPEAFYGLMNLLSTHDASRALYEFGYTSDEVGDNSIAEAKQRLKLAVLFQMTFPGSPAIFYGDEVGVTGGEDPYNRAPYPWSDQGGNPDSELLSEFKQLISLRNDNAILRRGSIDAPVYLDDHLIVLLREYQGHYALTAFNNSTQEQQVSLTLNELSNLALEDFVGENSVTVDNTGNVTLTVPALYGTVLISQ